MMRIHARCCVLSDVNYHRPLLKFRRYLVYEVYFALEIRPAFVFMEYRKMQPGMVLSGLVNSVEESVL